MGCCQAVDSQIIPAYPYKPVSGGIIKRRNQKYGKASEKTCDVDQLENIKKIQLQPSGQDAQMLNKAISQHFLLYRMPKTQRHRLIECLDAYECDQEAQIFKKGDPGTLFFIIKSGQVQVLGQPQSKGYESQKNGKKTLLSKLGRGDCFGDLALLYSSTRSATVKSTTKCIFFCISHDVFRRAVQQIVKKNYELSKSFIQKAPLFAYLSKRQKNVVAYNTLFLRFQKNDVIFREGDDANCLFIVTSGKVEIRINGKSSLEMKSGESFGQNALQENQKRSGTAVAMEKTSILSMSRDSLKKCLGNQLQQISFLNILKWAFARNDLLKFISNFQRQRLISSVQLKECKNQQIICVEGEKANFLVIVLEDRVNNKQVGTIFNTEYLMTQNDNDLKMTQRLVKNGKGYIALIKFEIINQVLGKNLHLITKNFPQIDIFQKRQEYLNKLTLSDFIINSKIGQGQFGKVYSVIDKFKKVYALKCILKQKIIDKKMQNFVTKQRQIMKLIESPFVVKLYKTFKDEHYLYLLTNFIDGADMFDLLRQIGLCNRKKAQFFMGCLILALQQMHQKNVIYRDLKPQNIVIDELGFLNIVDLGIAKILTEQSGYRTFTVVGTPHYMAPQIMEVQGYTFSADLWSLGIVLFEMVCGFLPFGNNTDDPYEIFKQIDLKDVEIPRNYEDKPGRQLILKLLSKNPSERFVQEYSKIKNMAFFQDFDWDGLQKKSISTPFKVKQKKNQKQLNQPLIKYLKKQKANLGKPPQSINWDSQF